ncbi:MAG: preprotein translocase subunit SecE, partial [Balneolaceae bacterium]
DLKCELLLRSLDARFWKASWIWWSEDGRSCRSSAPAVQVLPPVLVNRERRIGLNILMKKIKEFIEGVQKEFKKVTWPTQQELIDNTIIVVVFTIVISAFIFAVDQVYSTILDVIYQ